MALFSYPVCTWLCQYVNMGVRKWLEKSAEKQKHKLRKTLNPLSRKAFQAVSFSATKDKKEGMTKGHAFLFGFRGPKARSALRDFNARGGRATTAPRSSPLVKTLVRRKSGAAQKGR